MQVEVRRLQERQQHQVRHRGTERGGERDHLLAEEEPLFVIQPRHTPAYG